MLLFHTGEIYPDPETMSLWIESRLRSILDVERPSNTTVADPSEPQTRLENNHHHPPKLIQNVRSSAQAQVHAQPNKT